MSPRLSAQALRDQWYSRGQAEDLIGPEANSSRDWKLFAESWNGLPVDTFMGGGETYRRRRHTVFNVHTDGQFEQLAPRPYVQSSEINNLEGDVQRYFEPIEPEVTGSALFAGLLSGLSAILEELHGPDVWHHQCFQNRIVTSTEKTGDPTPWGPHCDGVDYVVTLLVARHNVRGGRTGLYDAGTKERLHAETLLPGDLLIADDTRTLHDATPLTPVDPAEPGHRDVFIDVITRGSEPR
ncbi:2OG-Fe dioxygenase family protein [Streptomyces sp. NPDC054796]